MRKKKEESEVAVVEVDGEVMEGDETPFDEGKIADPETQKDKKTKGKKKKEEDTETVDLSNMFWGLGTDIIKTDIHALDIILGGGYEPGDWIELTGEWGSGKSTLVMDICRRAFRKGKSIAYLDVENGVKASLLRNLGIDPSEVGQVAGKDRFLLVSPQNFKELEDAFRVIVSGKDSTQYDIIVIDSLSQVTQFDEDLSVTTKDIAQRARQEGVFFAEFKSELRRNKITVFVVNQVTKKFDKKGGMVVVTDESTGGNKAKHNFDVRVWMNKGTALRRKEATLMGSTVGLKGGKNDDKTVYGCVSSIKAKKNRAERPEIPLDIHVIFGRGISNPMFVDSVLAYKKYYSVSTAGWTFKSIPELPFLSECCGKKKIDRLSIIREHEAEIIEFLKEKGHWQLTSGVDEDGMMEDLDE